ncbi:MAG: phosphoribosylamine--glycine ligase [Lachnospiraceae bacterium]|nr:phosphoribosylamine--glycine ligase [Lachnospiraceae bacterium]
MKNIVVLVSGGGTNLQAIIDKINSGEVKNAKISGVISNNPGAYALERAEKAGIPAVCLSPKAYGTREEFNKALLEKVDSFNPDLVVLAGFLVIVPKLLIEKYRYKIINIHPSLIPDFCGKGFYGLKVHEAVLAAGVKKTGATVHFVDEGTDTGPIIMQKEVDVKRDDTPEVLQQRVMKEAEWNILPAAINAFCNGKIKITENGKVKLEMEKNDDAITVLVVGSGGREHALVWKIAKSKKVKKIYCAPGNAGIAELAECVDIKATDIPGLVAFAEEKKIDLTVIGMDDPLVAGVVDAFEEKGLRVFGPRKNAAILEGSKAFSKELMKKYNIPTAAYEVFDDFEAAKAYLEKDAKYPAVLKADGLALGKGVLICNTEEEALSGLKTLMLDKKFGSAGNKIVIEEFLTGREISVLSFVDGKTVKIMTSSQDYKRARDNDEGLNTGGMGNISPSPAYTLEVDSFCKKYIYKATVDAMAAEGREFKGVIFFGLMLTKDGPKVLEYNARFGDPETQVVLPRMKNDIVEVFEACIDGTLDKVRLEFEDNAAVCVVLASDGYPEKYEKGFEITGLDAFKEKEDAFVFHAGTKFNENGAVVTNGGRVLGVTALGKDLKEAAQKAYAATDLINFKNKYKRSDIGARL